MANIQVSIPQNTITVDSTTNTVNVASTTNTIQVSEQARTSNADIRAAISVANLSGYGNLSYDQTNGIIQHAGVSSSEIRGRISGTAPILYNAGTGIIDIDANAIFTGKTTDDLAEGTTNLYLNGAGTTTDLTEGTNQYFTSGRARAALSNVDGLAGYDSISGQISIPNSTDFVPEGSTNQYFTNARVDARMTTNLTNLESGDLVFDITVNETDLFVIDRSGLSSPQANAFLQWDELNDRFRMNIPGVIDGYIPVDTDDLFEGTTNLYLNGAGTTDDLAEGSANVWYTDARSRLALSGANGISYSNVTGVIELSDSELISGVEAGNGLTGGGNTGNVTLNVGQGYGITVGADDIAFANSVLSTLTDDVTTTANVTGANIIGSALQGNLTGTTADVTKINANHIVADVNDLGTVSGGLSVDLNSGTTVLANINGNITGISFSNIEAGSTVSIVIQQDAVGFRTLDTTTTPSNWTNWQFVGNDSTLSTGANAEDVLTVMYDGTNYLASLVRFEAESEINISGNITAGGMTINGEATITGNLEVTGNINYREVEDLLVQDQTITLNYGNASAQTSTIFVDRSGSTLNNTFIRWNETTDLWEFYDGTSTYTIPRTTTDLTEGTNLYYTTDRANAAIADYDGDITTTGNISANYITATSEFLGDIDGAVSTNVYNNTAGTLNKGKAVYLTGGNQGDQPHVDLANNLVAAEMPALGVIKENIGPSSEGQVVTSGVMNFSSHGFTQGADLYVNGAGDLTETIPTSEAELIQKIGKVVSPNHIIVQGAFRTNATPNLDDGNIFLGDTNNQARSVTPSTNFATTGNVFDLSNTITGVNSITTEVSDTQKMTLNANAGLIVNQAQATDNILADSANIDSEGYGFLLNGSYDSFGGNFAYSGSTDMFAIKFAGTITEGSPNIVVTDVADSQSAFPGNTAELANVNTYMAYTFTNNTFGDVKHFPRNAYVQSVDTGNNIITMSENATANATLTTSGAEGAVHAAMVNTNTGAVVRFATAYDAFGGSKTQIIADVPYVNPDAYGYGSSSGIRVADYTNASSGSLSDYTINTSAFAGTMHARQQFVSPGDYPKFADGLVIGKTTNLTNRAEFDVLSNFGLNMMWDGRESTGNPSKIPQYLLKSYTDNTLASSSAPSAGPRVFFTSAYGNADDAELSTYPRQNQELGRLTWWGTSGTNTGYSTTNPPAFISVQARDDWSAGGTRHGGNVDMYFAAAADHDSRADIFLTYDQGGRLILGSNAYNGNANSDVIIGHAQTGTSGNPHTAYDSDPEMWMKVNYGDPANSSGSMATITNGSRSGTGQVGEMLFAFDRINNTSTTITNYSVGGWGNGQTITDINTAFGGSWAANTGIAAQSVTLIDVGQTQRFTNGQRVDLQNATGDVNSSSLNGGTYYIFYQGYTGDSFYTLYTDAALTTEALYTVSWTGGYAGGPGVLPYETSWNGDIDAYTTVSGGVTDKKWIWKLPEQSDNLEIFEDTWTSGSGNSPHTKFEAGGNINISGNVTYRNITLPTTDGTNGQAITTDGNGALSFSSVGSGTVTSIDSGNGLVGGPVSTTGTFDVGPGDGITVNADDVAVNQGFDFDFTGAISASNLSLQKFQETVVALGNQSGDISSSLDADNGSIYTVTATGAITINSLGNARAGTSMTIIVTQDGSGGHTLSSTMKYAGGNKTLSTAPNSIDIISVFYDGTTYYASLTAGYA